MGTWQEKAGKLGTNRTAIGVANSRMNAHYAHSIPTATAAKPAAEDVATVTTGLVLPSYDERSGGTSTQARETPYVALAPEDEAGPIEKDGSFRLPRNYVENPNAPTLLYLHGVRWNLTGHLRRIENLRSFGFSVVAIDYRGFGKSDGEMPSEEGVYDDAHVAWRWLVAHERDPAKRYVYGHSLGTAVATHIATDEGARDGMAGLILEGGFTSLPEMAKALAPSWLPIDWLVTQRFDTIDKIARVPAPVLLVHGTGDRLVPHRFSEALYAAAPEPKKLVLVEGGGHYNTSWVGAAQYREAIAELFGVPSRGRAAAVGPVVGPFAALAGAAAR